MYKPMSASMRNGLLGWLNHIVSGIKKDINGVCGLFWALLAGAEFVTLSSSRRKSWGVVGKQMIANFLSKRTPISEFSLPRIEHNIASKRNSVTSRDSESREASLLTVFSPYYPQEGKC